VVHRYRRQIVLAARDGYIQLNRWSPVAMTEAGHLGR
jgi:methionyl-tRNA formyltransferase